MRFSATFVLLTLLFLPVSPAAEDKPSEPDVLKLSLEFRTVLQAAHAVLVDDPPTGMSLRLATGEKGAGSLVTEPYNYASGTLAKDHLMKIAVRPDLSDGTWEQVRYRMRITVEPVEKRETRIAADASVEALKRGFTGKEEWVTVPSNGSLEETFLLLLGRRLFGSQFSLETKKKNFWQRDPRYVPNPEADPGAVAKPDTKRW